MEEHEILLYGEVINDSDPMASEWGYVTLRQVVDALDAIPNDSPTKDILVRINSNGGDVDTGFAIYSALRRKAGRGFNIITRMDGVAASIATVMFLAGDTRIGNPYIDPFIHNAWSWGVGEAEDFERAAEQLRRSSERIANFYAEHTNLTEEQATQMMDEGTSLSTDELVEMGFATEIEELIRPAAMQQLVKRHKPKNNKSTMSEPTKEQNAFLERLNKVLNQISSFMNKAEKTLQNELGEELVFASLGENDMVEVGNSATVNDAPAEGEHIIPALAKVFTFEKGNVTEIQDHVSEEDSLEELQVENSRLTQENENLTQEVATLKTQNKEFETSLEGIKEELNELKNLASDFNYEGKSTSGSNSQTPQNSDQPKTRKMFKAEHYEEK